MSIELRVTAGQEKVFTCKVSGGNPLPGAIKWYLQDILLQEGASDLVVQITPDWQGKRLKCSVTQFDAFGNELTTSDERVVVVVSSMQQSRNLKGITTKRGQFTLRGTYPASGSILIAPDQRVTLSCTTSTPWLDCKWKHPKFKEPCSIFSDTNSRTCRNWQQSGVKGYVKIKLLF